MKLGKAILGSTVSLLAAATLSSPGSAQAQPVASARSTTCSSTPASGTPGTTSYTLHVDNPCDPDHNIYRAYISTEDFYGTTKYHVGAWVHSGISKATWSAFDTKLCYGYQHQYNSHSYTVWFNC